MANYVSLLTEMFRFEEVISTFNVFNSSFLAQALHRSDFDFSKRFATHCEECQLGIRVAVKGSTELYSHEAMAEAICKLPACIESTTFELVTDNTLHK